MADELTQKDVATLQWWTVREVANLFRVDKSTVNRWIKAKKIKAMRIGADWRIHRTEVARLESAGLPEAKSPQTAATRVADEWNVPNYT